MPIKKGDFILIDYVSTIKEIGEVFDTTIEEEAKRGKIFKENRIYEPMLVVVGERWILKALDDSLVNLKIGFKGSKIAPTQSSGFSRTNCHFRFHSSLVKPLLKVEVGQV